MVFPEIPNLFIPEKQYILEVNLCQKEASEIIPKGYELAWDQFVLHNGNSSPILTTGNNLEIIEKNNILIKNDILPMSFFILITSSILINSKNYYILNTSITKEYFYT